MFIASKLLAFLLDPLVWILVPLAIGVLMLRRWPRAGRVFCCSALLAALVNGWQAPPVAVLHALEQRYPPLPETTDMGRFKGVIVVGGALAHSHLWTTHGKVALNANAERMTTAVALARKFPHLRLLYTGGSGLLTGEDLSEAARARIFFDEMGVPTDRVQYEDKSRTTHENAVYSRDVRGIDPREPWLLLTSAYHMPRTMGVFLEQGWNVTPYPVDYRTFKPPSWHDYSTYYGPQSWSLALHEVVGYQAYKLAGKLK